MALRASTGISQQGYHMEIKWNEMNGVLGHICAHIGYTGPGEPPDDGEMNEMTLPSSHMNRNSSPGGLTADRYLSVREAPHNIESLRVRGGGGVICFFETWRPERETNPRSPTFQAALTTVPCRPPLEDWSALRGRGSGVVVKTACLECRDCGFEPHSGL